MAKTDVTDRNGQDYTKNESEATAEKTVIAMRENEEAFSSIKKAVSDKFFSSPVTQAAVAALFDVGITELGLELELLTKAETAALTKVQIDFVHEEMYLIAKLQLPEYTQLKYCVGTDLELDEWNFISELLSDTFREELQKNYPQDFLNQISKLIDDPGDDSDVLLAINGDVIFSHLW